MAKFALNTSDASVRKAYEEKLFRDAKKEMYFDKFMGEDASSAVQVKTELEKKRGDTVTIGLRMRLTGAGVTSGQTLEGNEEALDIYTDTVTLEQYRHAVRDDGAMTRQRAMFSVSEEQNAAIKDWLAEKQDLLCFNELLSNNTPTRVAYPDGTAGAFSYTATASTAQSALVLANSQITPNFISYCKTLAKTGRSRAWVPIRPLKVGGEELFVLLCHPDVMFDLKTDSNFQQARREAEKRGKDNPLFKNATAIWDGVVIHEHENCPIGTDGGGGSVPWAKCALMGQQSLTWAWGKKPKTIMKDFDYENEHSVAVDFIAGVNKNQFNSEDYGSLAVYVARTNVSGG